MKIVEIRVQNFRTLADVTISFDDVTTFIGPNGTGKSTVLRALDWFFNGRAGALSDQDCSHGAQDSDIVVRVTFSDLSDRDREELGRYAPPGAETFSAWKQRSPDGTESLSANAKSYGAFNAIREKQTAAEKKAAFNQLRSDDPSLMLPAWSNQDAAAEAMIVWEREHSDMLDDAPESLQTNFFGFNGVGKMSGLFDFVLVTADLRAGEESVDGRASILGRILERSVDRTSADEEIAAVIEASRIQQQAIFAEKFSSQIEAMVSQLNSVVETYSPGRAVAVAPAELELKAPRTSFNVTVLDGLTQTAVERQGHGFQRTLLISALQLLAQSGAASTEGVICLAIEEPELFQHPVQAQAFAKVLRSLAEARDKRMQVAYATHSPYFVETRYFHQVRRLTRTSDPSPKVTVHSATVEDIKTRLAGVLDTETVARQLDGVVSNQLPVALFANKAFIVEGTTEAAIFSGIGDRTSVGFMETHGVAIVPAGGKTTIPLVHAIVEALGIPCYALFDSDAGYADRARANGKTEANIIKEGAGHIAANQSVLRYFGVAEVDFPPAECRDDFSVFEDHLEAYLSAEWPEWEESCAALESETGMSLRKNQSAYRTATRATQSPVPEFLKQIVSRVTALSGP